MERSNANRKLGNDNGVVAIEFVLIAPLLFLLVFGIIQFGRAYNAKIELTAAVREGARVLALDTGDPVDTTVSAAPGLEPDSIAVTTSTDPCTAGDPAWVRAEYAFDLDVPLFGSQVITIAAKGVMRCGG